MKNLLLVALTMMIVGAASLHARDTRHMYSIEEAFASPDFESRLDGDVQFFFGEAEHPPVARNLGEYVSNKKTNAANKSDRRACEWVFLSVLLQFQERARAEGGNAVVNVRSYYKKREVSSETEFECTAGTFVAGMALIGEVVQLEEPSPAP